jgi:neutral/alkaline ceramidase-like enzyme
MNPRFKARLLAGILISGMFAVVSSAQEKGSLRVGAARVDITPAPDAALPMSGYAGRKHGFDGIHDHIYARAIVLDDGTRQAAIVAWEVIGVPDQVWEEVTRKIAAEAKIQPEYVMLAGVHDHSAPTVQGAYGASGANMAAYTAKLENDTLEAVRQAQARLQPARVGYGSSTAYVNINRRELTPDRGWQLGYNPEGPSDKTVAVLKFESLSGKPIALFINYAVHGVVMGQENYQISGDLPGATSRFVERYYSGQGSGTPRGDVGSELRLRPDDKATDQEVIAVWTSGAAGDQNPVSLARGSDFTMVDALGQILGEAAIRAVSRIRTTDQARLWAKQQTITCPGRRLTAGPHPNNEYKFEDSDPVNIRLSLIMLNDIALAGVSGEVLTPIYWHLKKEEPFTHTIMVTHANGLSGYIPNDSAFDQVSYEIRTSHLKPDCAENGIVNGFLGMMSEYK